MTQREDKEKSKAARENLGKYFFDISKGCFMVMVAGNAVTIKCSSIRLAHLVSLT